MNDVPQLIRDVLPDGRHERYHVDLAALWREIDALAAPPRVVWDWSDLMRQRYNPDGTKRRTYADIARERGVSSDRPHQIVKHICRLLRNPARLPRWAARKR